MGNGASANAATEAKEMDEHDNMLMNLRKKRMERKYSTTGTMFVTSTISVPDVDHILLCFSALLDMMCTPLPNLNERVDPKADPKKKRPTETTKTYDAFTLAIPDHVTTTEKMFEFLKKAFELAQWSPECHVISAVFIGRLLVNTDLKLHKRNWVNVVLIALLLAQKVWDDRCLPNSEFPTIWTQCGCEAAPTKKDINRMESAFLGHLHYDVHVPRQLYTKYYFEMRALHPNPNLDFPLKPLTEEKCRMLEVYQLQNAGKNPKEDEEAFFTHGEKQKALDRKGVQSVQNSPQDLNNRSVSPN
jgi:hypothetical protein